MMTIGGVEYTRTRTRGGCATWESHAGGIRRALITDGVQWISIGAVGDELFEGTGACALEAVTQRLGKQIGHIDNTRAELTSAIWLLVAAVSVAVLGWIFAGGAW